MLLAVLAAIAIYSRVPLALAVGTVVLSFVSLPFAVGAVLAVAGASAIVRWKKHDGGGEDEGELLRLLAGRVAAGATIRSAIADASVSAVPERARRLAALGQPMASVGDALFPALPANGVAFRGICSFSEHTGAAVSAALEVLADQADDVAELKRERRVSLAQVKLSAIVVGVVPMAVSIGLVAIRGVPAPGGALIVLPMIAGFALQTAGTAIVFSVASRSTL